jgi:hypothetical protein
LEHENEAAMVGIFTAIQSHHRDLRIYSSMELAIGIQ